MIPKLTSDGYSLMIRALDGEGLTFTKIKIGNGNVPDNYASLTDIVNPIISIGITTITKSENYVVLKAPMSNSDLDSGFEMAEMGVFAADPDGGEDILYAYAHYKLSGDAAAVYVPPVASNLVEITHNVHVYIGELDNVTAILAESSEYAMAKDLDDHMNDKGNPHKVGKDDVGLGNVPNVTPENQQPTFSNSVTAVITDSSGNKSLPNISSGEKMGVILQKVRSVIAAFVSHINAKNPHGIDAYTIGAAKSTHYHSANDINSGVLSVIRGGTGGKSAAEARQNLGIQCGTNTVPVNQNTYSYCVYFAHPFIGTTPKVVISPKTISGDPSNYRLNECALSVVYVSVNYFLVQTSSETVSGDIAFDWIAIQQ